MIFECAFCKKFVEATEEGGFVNGDHTVSVTLYKCKQCESPILIKSEEDWEFYYYEEGGEEYSAPCNSWTSKVIYPSEEMQVNPKAPPRIRKTLEEAFVCYKAKAYTAATIMCRKTLEGVCKEHEIDEGNLYKSLRVMKEKRIIDERLFEWPDTLRVVGNEAAHGVDFEFSPDDTKDAINFTIGVIDYLFSYRKQFEEFRNRRLITSKSF